MRSSSVAHSCQLPAVRVFTQHAPLWGVWFVQMTGTGEKMAAYVPKKQRHRKPNSIQRSISICFNVHFINTHFLRQQSIHVDLPFSAKIHILLKSLSRTSSPNSVLCQVYLDIRPCQTHSTFSWPSEFITNCHTIEQNRNSDLPFNLYSWCHQTGFIYLFIYCYCYPAPRHSC